MCNDATNAVEINTGLNSVLIFILLLRHIIKAICTMKSSRHLVVLRKKNSPTGEIIQDRAQQMERWVEHYPELSARERIWCLWKALNATECLLMYNKSTKVKLKEALEYLHLEKCAARMVIPGRG